MEVNTTCTVSSGLFEGQDCDGIQFTGGTCTARPSSLQLRYAGGSCLNSLTSQRDGFSCIDTDSGPPPDQMGNTSYIIVTDTVKQGTVYFRDTISVGETYTIEPLLNEEMPDFLRVLVYTSSDTGDPANLLQAVQFASSCDKPLRLKDRLGASQVVGYENEDQGSITCLAPVSIQLDIGLPESFPGGSASMTQLIFFSNFDGFQDLSDLVTGITLEAGESFPLVIEDKVLDLSVRSRYTALTLPTSTVDQSGLGCEGRDFQSFIAGHPGRPLAPTAAPTVMPSVSPAPTADNLQTACSIESEIVCECLSGDGVVVGDCDNIVDPSTVTCTNDLPATGLSFKYVGFDEDDTSTSPNEVIVEIESLTSGFFASTSAVLGITFQVQGNLGNGVQISTFSISADGEPEDLLDQTLLNTECSMGDSVLTLTSRFGALELVGFENASGSFSSIVPIRLTYSIANTGDFAMVAESALIDSEFLPDTLDALPSETPVDGNDILFVFSETSNIDTEAKFSQNTVLEFSMTSAGRAERSGLSCEDQTLYFF